MQKQCTKCFKILDANLTNFNKNPTHFLGFYSKCKKCVSEYNRLKKFSKRKIITQEEKRLSIERKKISNRLSSPIAISIKNGRKSNKPKQWEKILDYSLEDLKRHLESKFRKGMNWDNYGKWTIDHIIPKKLFDFKSVDDEEMKKCWKLENLQPLWRKENEIKGTKDFRKCNFNLIASRLVD